MDTRDYWSQKEEDRPKWMPQVLRTIEAEAPKNPVAQHFLDEMRARTAAVGVTAPLGAMPELEAHERTVPVSAQEPQLNPQQAVTEQPEAATAN